MTHQEVLDLLTVVRWPVAAVLLGVIGFILFRKSVVSLLDRITSVSREGLKTSAPTGQIAPDTENVSRARELIDVLASPVIKETEARIKNDLKERGLDYQSETAQVLTSHLAATQLVVFFEETYRIIFGSQIFMLKIANQNRADGVSFDDIAAHFKNLQQVHSPAFDKWTTDTYVSFLLSSSLLTAREDRYRVTNLGVEFLQWMAKNGIPEGKNL